MSGCGPRHTELAHLRFHGPGGNRSRTLIVTGQRKPNAAILKYRGGYVREAGKARCYLVTVLALGLWELLVC